MGRQFGKTHQLALTIFQSLNKGHDCTIIVKDIEGFVSRLEKLGLDIAKLKCEKSKYHPQPRVIFEWNGEMLGIEYPGPKDTYCYNLSYKI